MGLGGWLLSLALAQYETTFRENTINEGPKRGGENVASLVSVAKWINFLGDGSVMPMNRASN
jgi:hypothetical protein